MNLIDSYIILKYKATRYSHSLLEQEKRSAKSRWQLEGIERKLADITETLNILSDSVYFQTSMASTIDHARI